jgi:hypothetical protein
MSSNFKLYIIYSTDNLENISKFLSKYTTLPNKIGPIRKDYTRNIKTGAYNKSNRRLVILDESVFINLCKSGFDNPDNDFCIMEYEIRKDNKPPYDSVMHLYFPYSIENKEKIRNKLDYISNITILNKDCYHIHDGMVEFSSSVNDFTRIIVKIIVDNYSDSRVSWCRKKFYKKVNLYF